MRRHAKYTLALIFLILGSSGCLSPLHGQKNMRDKMRKQIEKLIWFETDIDRELTPGFLIAVIDGTSQMVLPFGIREKATEDTIAIDDIFELGSVTKVFTAALFAELDRKQVLSLSRKFDPFLPEEFQNPHLADITVADLLAHQSGLPRDPVEGSRLGNQLRHYDSYSMADLLSEYRDFKSAQRMVYSNVGYALLPMGLPHDFETMIKDYVCRPNGLSVTSFNADSLAPGYGVYDTITGPTQFGVFKSSGGLKSSMGDLLKFMRYCLNSSPEMMWKDRGPGMTRDLRMALGWHYLEQKNGPVYIHTGRTLGHSAFVGLCPVTTTAVIILANSATGTDDLGMEVLRIMNNNWNRKS